MACPSQESKGVSVKFTFYQSDEQQKRASLNVFVSETILVQRMMSFHVRVKKESTPVFAIRDELCKIIRT